MAFMKRDSWHGGSDHGPRHHHRHVLWHEIARVALPIVLGVALLISALVWWIDPAPPRTIRMSAGPLHSVFMNTALQYQKVLARNGVNLELVESSGSVENLKRLLEPHGSIDVAFVQSGIARGMPTDSLVSLGSVFYVPLVVFSRGYGLRDLSQIEGKRVAVGEEGSGTHVLALALLAANGIVPGGSTTLLPLSAHAAAQALTDGSIDVALFSGESTTRALLLKLHETPSLSLMDFSQATAYTRLFPYLSEVVLPRGVLDLPRDLPPQDVHLISPTVELVARSRLHPAISDLLIEAAQEVNGPAGLLQRAGEFPSPVARGFRMSDDALRYYRSGKSFLYRYLPFWLATVADRLLVLLLPAMVLLFPCVRFIPALISWRMKSKIYRFYGLLIALERRALNRTTPEEKRSLIAELDSMEAAINGLRMPLVYADALYVLREHVGFVRARLTGSMGVARSV
jgi:hypothetical protein